MTSAKLHPHRLRSASHLLFDRALMQRKSTRRSPRGCRTDPPVRLVDSTGRNHYLPHMSKIAVIPGDGTGPEVVREGIKVLTAAAGRFSFPSPSPTSTGAANST